MLITSRFSHAIPIPPASIPILKGKCLYRGIASLYERSSPNGRGSIISQ
nr:hypothetical protein [Candidatus Sigynarchaeota archaeon]